jgi:hypothetical protein
MLDPDSQSKTSTEPGMSSYTLKMIAIIAMLIDHIGWAFVPTGSVLGQIMHTIGRLTAPIMCFFIAEGYYHTRNAKRYALRLFVFALISHAPFYYFTTGELPFPFSRNLRIPAPTSVMYSLFLGLLSLIVWHNEKLGDVVRLSLILLLCILALPGDWGPTAVLWIFLFGIHHGNFKQQVLAFSVVAIPIAFSSLIMLLGGYDTWYEQLFQMGVYLCIPLLARYNGERGGSKASKWFFYVFYPLHLMVLGLIKYDF